MVGGVSDYKSLKVDSVMVCGLNQLVFKDKMILIGIGHKGIDRLVMQLVKELSFHGSDSQRVYLAFGQLYLVKKHIYWSRRVQCKSLLSTGLNDSGLKQLTSGLYQQGSHQHTLFIKSSIRHGIHLVFNQVLVSVSLDLGLFS